MGKNIRSSSSPKAAMSLSLLKFVGQASLVDDAMLPSDGFNGTVGVSLSQVLLESVSEYGQLTIGLEATEGLVWASSKPAAVHLSAISAFLQRLTLRVT